MIILSAPERPVTIGLVDSLIGKFQCTSVVDEWWPSLATDKGALHLTRATPNELAAFELHPDALVVAVTARTAPAATERLIRHRSFFRSPESFLDAHAEDEPPKDGGLHVRVRIRKAYDRFESDVWVPLAVYEAAYGPPASSLDSAESYAEFSALNTSTVSAAEAPGSACSVIALAVTSRSNTSTAIADSIPSARLFRISSRDVKALEALGFVMGSLSVVGVVEDTHRKAEQGPHPSPEAPV